MVTQVIRFTRSQTFRLLMVIIFVLLVSAVSLAQTATPVPPTATNVMLVVPTNDIFTATNSWMQTFAPVVAIGVGIAVALAILTFIGQQILKAFGRGGK